MVQLIMTLVGFLPSQVLLHGGRIQQSWSSTYHLPRAAPMSHYIGIVEREPWWLRRSGGFKGETDPFEDTLAVQPTATTDRPARQKLSATKPASRSRQHYGRYAT